MANQTYLSTDQKHYIDPWNQRVFQFNTDQSDVFLGRVANSVFRIFGDDIVLSGLGVTGVAHDPDAVSVTLNGGDLLQDNTLLKFADPIIDLTLAGLSGLDVNGRVVILSNYRYLETFEQNNQHFQINYINPSGVPLLGFDESRDRIVLGIFQFTKDGSDNVTSFFTSPDTEIIINGKNYYLKGYGPENRRLTMYLLHQLFTAGLSIVFDPVEGIKLKNDVDFPGESKYYGTGPTGEKGFFDISELGYDNLSTIADFMSGYNQVLYNGNLFFVKDGHDVSEFFAPPLEAFDFIVFNEEYWQDNLTSANWDGSSWNRINPTGWWYLVPTANGWQENFRPTRVRITGEGYEGGGEVELRDASNVLICQQAVSAVVDMICDFSTAGDIASMNIVGFSKITNIEFLGGTLGPAT